MRQIQAVFFDYGGVIGFVAAAAVLELEAAHGLPDLLRCIYTIPEYRAAERGEIEEEVWIAAANAALDEKAGRPVPELHEVWPSRIGVWRKLDENVVALAKALGSNYRVALISNSTKKGLEKDLLQPLGVHDVHDLFEVVVTSARVGIAKPDTRIYHYAAEQLGVEPSACVHIDDHPPNVDGAIAAGFAAVYYQGDFTALAESLRSLGLEW